MASGSWIPPGIKTCFFGTSQVMSFSWISVWFLFSLLASILTVALTLLLISSILKFFENIFFWISSYFIIKKLIETSHLIWLMLAEYHFSLKGPDFLVYTTFHCQSTEGIRIRWKFSGSDQKGPGPTGSGSDSGSRFAMLLVAQLVNLIKLIF